MRTLSGVPCSECFSTSNLVNNRSLRFWRALLLSISFSVDVEGSIEFAKERNYCTQWIGFHSHPFFSCANSLFWIWCLLFTQWKSLASLSLSFPHLFTKNALRNDHLSSIALEPVDTEIKKKKIVLVFKGLLTVKEFTVVQGFVKCSSFFHIILLFWRKRFRRCHQHTFKLGTQKLSRLPSGAFSGIINTTFKEEPILGVETPLNS